MTASYRPTRVRPAIGPRARIAMCVSLALCAVVALPGAGSARESREVKRVKRALVRIEKRLDAAKTEVDRLHDRIETLDAVAKSTRAALAVTARHRTANLWSRVRFWSDLISLLEARSEAAALAEELPEAQQAVWDITAQRADKIDDLDVLVRVSRANTRNPLPSWSVSGRLITYSADWEAVSMCESSGRWHINSQYDGGLQFHPRTWIGFGGGAFARHAYDATKKQQIAVAERVLAIQGPQAWPNCFHPLPFHF